MAQAMFTENEKEIESNGVHIGLINEPRSNFEMKGMGKHKFLVKETNSI